MQAHCNKTSLNHIHIMNSKKLVLLLCLIFPFFSHAQHNHSQHNPVNCSVSKEAGALIKARLMQNRQLFDTKEVEDLVNKRTITYLPLSIHNVSGGRIWYWQDS